MLWAALENGRKFQNFISFQERRLIPTQYPSLDFRASTSGFERLFTALPSHIETTLQKREFPHQNRRKMP